MLPPEKYWSAVKLPVAEPPALIDTLLGGGVVTGGVVGGGVVTGGVVGGGVVGVWPPPATVMALILGFSVTAVNWITTWPLALAMVSKVRAMARLAPPAEAKISKLLKAAAPLIDTLN